MPALYAPKHLLIGIDSFATNISSWIGRAKDCAERANPGAASSNEDTTLVVQWFGRLNPTQVNKLRDNLRLMKDVINYPKTSIHIVDAPCIEKDRNFYAQVRGGYNALMPVLSVEVAAQWPNANLDTKVNTLFHELSHRILKTVDLGPSHGYPQTMYGISNAQSLASRTPDDALRNAENYGYFIALCNRFNNQA